MLTFSCAVERAHDKRGQVPQQVLVPHDAVVRRKMERLELERARLRHDDDDRDRGVRARRVGQRRPPPHTV